MMKRMLQAMCVMMGLWPAHTFAQQTARFRPASEALFRTGDAAAQRLYALAAQSARESLNQSAAGIQPAWPSRKLYERYVAAIGDLRTDAPHCLDSARALLPQIIPAALRDRLSLAIAQYYFIQGKLAEAIPYYEAAGIANLSNHEIADAKFELAYAYFNNRQFVAANTLFAVMKEVPGRYYSPGNYYYGLLAYNDGDFEAAQKSFDRINNEPLYRPVVPYYIAELYYFMGKREKALSEALHLIQRPEKSYYDNELHLLVAQCLFEGGRYGDALPYFEHYYEHAEKIRKEELYEMGYSYYRVNEWKSAIEKFKPLSATQDSLGQTAMYLLGDSYLKSGNKEHARNAFGICAGMPYSKGQREASLLLHAKLSYELGYADDAMRSVRTLIADNPDSKYAGEARVLLSQLYLQTNNFKDAYEALLQGESGVAEYRQIRQRAAYGYAMQELQRQHLQNASGLLSDALANDEAPRFTEAALFWKAEAAYRLHQYDSAAFFADQFLAFKAPIGSGPQVSTSATREHALLTLGYASMELKDFKKAQQAFGSARTAGGAAGTTMNASLREADALFMQKDFLKAAPLYASVANGRGGDADYARLQSAIIAGLRGDDAEKTRLLQTLLNAVPPSPYATEARYELGVVQLGANKYNEAIATLQPLTSGRSSAAFAPKSLLKIGTAQQQLDQVDKALETYTRILREWSNAPERADAMAALKSIYIDRNQPDAYSKLLQDFNLPGASDAELDTAYYNAAEAQYAGSKWNEAQVGFNRYLQLYPEGSNALKARYYLGNSYYNQKQYKAARATYDTLLQGEWNRFSQESALKAAEIAVADTAWRDALRYYTQLSAHASAPAAKVQAYTGMMRAALRLNDVPFATLYADTLLAQEGLAPAARDEAQLLVVRRNILAGRTEEADALLTGLQESANGAIAAEARYYAAQRLLAKGKLKDAETAASRNVKLSAGYEYWVVKTYLLLSDILVQEKDYFNARATLQSVIQHATIPALKEEARKKLEALKTTESSKLSND